MSIYRLFNRSYRDYVRSDGMLRQLNIIILSAAIGTFLITAHTGVAFAGYASALGAGELAFGLLNALPVLAGLLQLYVSYILAKTGKFKKVFLVGGIVQRSSWVVIAFIPYIFPVADSRLFALIVLVTLAAMGGSFVVISHMTLMSATIPIEIRGRYITTRQRVSTAAALLFGLTIALLLDNMPGFLGYSIVFGLGGIAGLIDILMYTRVDFSGIPHKPNGFSLKEGIKTCFTTKRMRNYLIFWTFWSFAIHLNGPFFNKYAVDVLQLSYITIIILGQIAAQTVMFLIVARWGVFLDRYGSVPMMLISSLASTTIVFVWLFAAPGVWWPLLVFNLVGGIFWCANDACMVNMQLSHTPDKGRPTALAVYAVFTSLAIAAGLILGGALLEMFSPIMERLEWTVFGTSFDHYKIVFCIGIIIRYVVIGVFLPRVWNEKRMHYKEAYKKFGRDMKSRWNYRFSGVRFRR